MKSKNIIYLNIVLAIVNAVLGIINAKWFLVLAALFLSALVLLGALKYLVKPTYENLRSFSWYNIIAGLSILSLAWSSFYGLPTLGFAQIIAALLITLGACYTLYLAVKEGKVALIP